MTGTAPVEASDDPSAAVAEPAPLPPPGTSLRARTDIRFAILVAAVLASSVVAFGAIYLALPSVERLFQLEIRPCLQRAVAVAATLPVEDGVSLGTNLSQRCTAPFFRGQAMWVGSWLVVEVGLAGLLYALHSWWLVQRRRLTPLSAADNADVLAELDDLSRQAGLARAPEWLLAPYAATHGGQAFGLPGRRRVCLDVGLLVRYDVDRAGFRAVVRHELAHLHNRDVGRTYLTIAIWWSFVVTALSPFVVLSLNPNLLRRLPSWSWPSATEYSAALIYRFAALVALTIVVYLARNAILRTREVHADVVAAGWDAPHGALPQVVGALPWPPATPRWPGPRRWRPAWIRLGTHPAPAERLQAMADPGRLSRYGGWEMAGLGLVTGLVLNNVGLFAGNLFSAFLVPGLALLALPVGMLLVGLLAAAVRGAPGAPRGAGRRDTVMLPVALAVGFAASGPLSLLAADTGLAGPDYGVGVFALTSTLLAVGALLVAAWVRSMDQALADRPVTTMGRRRQSRAIVATAVAVGAPLFALWYICMFGNFFTQGYLGDLPKTGWAIEWYSTLTAWTGVYYEPQSRLSHTPVASAGLVLLWAVPAVLMGWWRPDGDRPAGVNRALLVGAIAGLAVVAIGLVLPYAARAALPLDVRRTPVNIVDAPLYFLVVYHNTYIAVAVLAQATAAGIVAAAARLRPVLVPLAVTTTAVLATFGVYANWGMATCMNLTGSSQHCGPRAFLPDAYVAFHLHTIVTWGAAAALPAALLGTAIGALWRRGRLPVVSARVPGHHAPPARWLTTTSLGVLAALVLASAAAAVPGNYSYWKPSPPPTTPAPVPAPTSTAPTADPCVIGTWREVSRRFNLALVGSERAWFTSSGITQTFRSDGVVAVEYGTGVTHTASVEGQRVELVETGGLTARYRTDNGTISYDEATGNVTQAVKINGVVRASGTLDPIVLSSDRYTCASDTMSQSAVDTQASDPYQIELRRIKPEN